MGVVVGRDDDAIMDDDVIMDSGDVSLARFLEADIRDFALAKALFSACVKNWNGTFKCFVRSLATIWNAAVAVPSPIAEARK